MTYYLEFHSQEMDNCTEPLVEVTPEKVSVVNMVR